MQKISGQEVSGEIIQSLRQKSSPPQILAAILVGDDPASLSFLKQKDKTAKELGVDFRTYRLSADLKNDDLRGEVGKIAKQKRVGGVLVQLPLPAGVNQFYVLNAIPHNKDVDVLSERALGAFYNNRNLVMPPAVEVTREIVERQKIQLVGTRAAVVGLGTLVGKPTSLWLANKCKELFLLGQGSDLKILRQADLIISGVGQGGLIKPGLLKAGAGGMDFGD